MTDKQILEEIYIRLKDTVNNRDIYRRSDIISFIEQEWQKADDQELVDQYNRNRKPEDQIKDVNDIKPPPSWVKEDWGHSYPSVDVKEIERHRGLEIGEDGTVTAIVPTFEEKMEEMRKYPHQENHSD
jgi:hypothetical protein